MSNDALLQEWIRSTDTEEGGAYIVNRYGEGAPGNPVFSYDRETVQMLIEQSTVALTEALQEKARAKDAAHEALQAEVEQLRSTMGRTACERILAQGTTIADYQRTTVERIKRIDELKAEVEALADALEKAVDVEARALWNRCFDCDTPGSCTGEKLCIAGERAHTWIHGARDALALAGRKVKP